MDREDVYEILRAGRWRAVLPELPRYIDPKHAVIPGSLRWGVLNGGRAMTLTGMCRPVVGGWKTVEVTAIFRDVPTFTESLQVQCACQRMSCEHAAALLHHALAIMPPRFDANATMMAAAETYRDDSEASASEHSSLARDGVDIRLGLLLKDFKHLSARPVLLWSDGGRAPRHIDVDKAIREGIDLPMQVAEELGTLSLLPVDAIPDRIEYPYPTRILVSKHQERVFERILERGDVYWMRVSASPLARGPDITPALDWKLREDGSQVLGYVLPPRLFNTRSLRGHSLWYYNEARRILGRVHAPKALDQVTHQQRLVVPARHAAETARAWRDNPRVRHLPAPVSKPTMPSAVIQLAPSAAYIETDGRPGIRVGYSLDGKDLDLTDVDSEDGIVVRRGDEYVRVAPVAAAGESKGMDAAASSLLTRAHLVATDDGAVFVSTRNGQAALAEIHNVATALAQQGASVNLSAMPSIRVLDAEALPAVSLTDDGTGREFLMDVHVSIDGAKHSLTQVLAAVLADPGFSLLPSAQEDPNALWALAIDEHLVRLPVAHLRQLVRPIAEWLATLDAKANKPLKLSRLQAAAVAHEVDDRSNALPDLRRAIAALVHLDQRPPPTEPAGFRGALRPYQRQGLAWLRALAEGGLGGALADDMGLGKTVQLLAHIQEEKNLGRLDAPALVVAPTSLVFNWRDEAAQFTPGLKRLVFHGSERAHSREQIKDSDLVITTYATLARDIEDLVGLRFSMLIADEAQAVQNHKTQAAKACRRLRAARALSVTGTPLQNHLGDLWAQFDLVLPGLLGAVTHFTKAYRTPIEKHRNAERRSQLIARLRPFLLRRTKAEVATDLPPKTISTLPVEIDGAQRVLYETLRVAQHERVREAIAQHGIHASGIVILDALLKLRQVCCDPRLVKLDAAKTVTESAKLDALSGLLRTLIDEGRHVLVFSAFAEMLALISQHLGEMGIGHLMLTGDTVDREGVVKQFQGGEVPVFLISLKAGGSGLNLTQADTVVHYDPWWNPAAEDQATDRAHRIGQLRPVMVYRLICAGTLEDTIRGINERKAALAQSILESAESGGDLRFTEEDVEAMFAPINAA